MIGADMAYIIAARKDAQSLQFGYTKVEAQIGYKTLESTTLSRTNVDYTIAVAKGIYCELKDMDYGATLGFTLTDESLFTLVLSRIRIPRWRGPLS